MSDKEEKKKTSITVFKTPSMGVLGIATLIMLFAKCFGYAPDLSWWIVTCPLWGPWAICIGFFVAFYAFAMLMLGVYVVLAGLISLCLWICNIFKKKTKDDNDYELYS